MKFRPENQIYQAKKTCILPCARLHVAHEALHHHASHSASEGAHHERRHEQAARNLIVRSIWVVFKHQAMS